MPNEVKTANQLKAEIKAEVQSELVDPLREELQRLSNLVEGLSKDLQTSTKTKADAKHQHPYMGKAHWEDLNKRIELINNNIRTIAKHSGLEVKEDKIEKPKPRGLLDVLLSAERGA